MEDSWGKGWALRLLTPISEVLTGSVKDQFCSLLPWDLCEARVGELSLRGFDGAQRLESLPLPHPQHWGAIEGLEQESAYIFCAFGERGLG